MTFTDRPPLYLHRSLLFGALLLLMPVLADAFLVQTFEFSRQLIQVKWQGADQGISFVIHDAGSDDMPAETAYRLLRESFQVWEQVPTATIAFRDEGLTQTLAPSRNDGRNLLFFDENNRWLQAPRNAGIIAVTRINSDDPTGAIIDADIIFNGRDFRFIATPEEIGNLSTNRIYLKDVAVHEIGHFLGLDHSPIQQATTSRPTMTPFSDIPGEAQSLEADDIAGVSVLYPSAAFQLRTGTIAGQVADTAAVPLFGVGVFAENTDTGELYGTLAGAAPTRSNRGSYLFQGLTPGIYRLHIAPVVGAINENNFGGIFSNFTTTFPLEYFGNTSLAGLAQPVGIEAGKVVDSIDFTTGFILPGFPSITPVFTLANTPDSHGPYTVRARLGDATAADLLYRTSAQLLPSKISMDQGENGLYQASISGQPVGTQIFYQLQAHNDLGRTTIFPADGQWRSFEIVELSGAPLAFIAVRDEDIIQVIDTKTQMPLASIAVGDEPIQTVLSLDGGRLFVSNLSSQEVYVIDTSTFQIVDRIATGTQPLDMALSPDGRTIYVSNSGGASVTAIDIATGEARGVPINQVTPGPHGLAIGAEGDIIYITHISSDQVLAFTTDGRLITQIPVPPQPRSLAINQEGTKLFVTSFNSSSLAIISLATAEVTSVLELPVAGTFAASVHPAGRKLYLTAHLDNAVVVVDLQSETTLKTIPVGADPRALSFSPTGDRLFVTSAIADQIVVIDTDTDTTIETYASGRGPRGISIVQAPETDSVPTFLSTAEQPESFVLHPNFPNPFNASTQISYSIPIARPDKAVEVHLTLFNLAGQHVRTLASGRKTPGTYLAHWDGKDQYGEDTASGIYFLKLQTSEGQAVQKMLLLR